MKGCITFALILIVITLHCKADEKPIVVLTASYNNKDWYERNLESICSQNYKNWRLIYINDASSDGTGQLVKEYISSKGYLHRATLIDNSDRKGHLHNQYHAIHACKSEEIIIILDGDDWFPHDNVMRYINHTYTDDNVWMTYGQFWYFKRNVRGMCHAIPSEYVQTNKARDYPTWVLSHLRTFYAGLFKMIALEDLMYKGNFYPMFADGVVMYPMFEMAAERARFIPDVLCVYNDANQLSFMHGRAEKQMEIRKHVLSNKRYERIQSIFS